MNKVLRTSLITAIFAASSLTALASPDLNPSPSPAESASKVFQVSDVTSHINVFFNDIVLFKVGDRQFAVKFDGNKTVYTLDELAPTGFAAPKVRVYVSPNPNDRGVGFP